MSEIIRAWLLKPVLDFLRHIERTIAMNQAELAAELGAIKDQNEKARAEILAKVAALEAALAAAGKTTPDVDAALAALKVSVQADDDLNPDDPAP
jgi:hypothetical protein